MRVLDLGCGTGTLTVLLAKSCPQAEVVGLDADPMSSSARERVRLARSLRSWAAGKLIRLNFGEHVVVLTSLRGNGVRLNDPLSGSRLVWTRAQFLAKWRLLGRRALGLS